MLYCYKEMINLYLTMTYRRDVIGDELERKVEKECRRKDEHKI